MKFKVIVQEILEKDVFIDAEDEYDAIDKVEELYEQEDIVLDAEDYINTTFECGRINRNRC